MHISVVIPTCNRKSRLLSLLKNLDASSYPVFEVIVVDSGQERLDYADYSGLKNIRVIYTESQQSVCIQRNTGIARATAPWIFICDDDIEVPADYLEKIVDHIKNHPEEIAVSGLVMQLENDKWTAKYPISSTRELLWKYTFKLGIWGEIKCKKNFISSRLKKYYDNKGNHISKAGWPVLTDFSGNYFAAPVYGLGAALIKKEWLMKFPYPEVLDKHGIGDNYGVAINFPANSIHVLNDAFVYHHQETVNRLQRPLQYFRRVLALHYFIETNANIHFVKRRWLVWSLMGNLFGFILARDHIMIKPSLKLIRIIIFGKNPYTTAAKSKQKVTEPVL